MAIGSTVHTFEMQLADTDRGVYEDVSLRVARHPSETDAYMLTRVLAYGLEFAEGIAFGGSVSDTDEPAVLVRDLTGRVTVWIEVGAPDAGFVDTATPHLARRNTLTLTVTEGVLYLDLNGTSLMTSLHEHTLP